MKPEIISRARFSGVVFGRSFGEFGLGFEERNEKPSTTVTPENSLVFPAIYLPETKTRFECDYPQTTFTRGKTLVVG